VSVQSIERIFDIIELLSKSRDGMALSDIGRQLDLHKSTVHRLMAVLKERGYIEQHPETSAYRIGPRFIEISSLYLNNLEIKTEAEPYLRELSRTVGQTAFIAVLQDGEVVYIDKYEQYNSLRKYSIIGKRRPLYCTSLGKALLFDKQDEEIRALVRPEQIKRFTPNTVENSETFIEEIHMSRQRGWAVDDQEEESGVQCAGAPVYDYRGHVIAAISVSWRIAETPAAFSEVGPHVVKTASAISARLGAPVVKAEPVK